MDVLVCKAVTITSPNSYTFDEFKVSFVSVFCAFVLNMNTKLAMDNNIFFILNKICFTNSLFNIKNNDAKVERNFNSAIIIKKNKMSLMKIYLAKHQLQCLNTING